MINCFVESLKCIFCCEHDTHTDPYGDRYLDHDNSYFRIHDEGSSHRNLFYKREEIDPAPPSFIFIREHTSSGSNSTTSIPAEKAFVSSSTKYCQTVRPSSTSAFAASSTSSNQLKPEPSKPSQPHVTLLPPTASSKRLNESISKQPHTHSSSIPFREQAPSSMPSPFTSSSTSSSSKPPPVASSKPKSSPTPSSSSFEPHEGDSKPVKAVLRPVSSEGNKATYSQEDTSPIYMIPKKIQDIIKRDKVPEVLRSPLTPLTYKDYFASLLYAEDFHMEKWSEFELMNVSLQLLKVSVYKDRKRNAKDDRIFVAFEVDSVPERRPFFLSRDFVFAKPVGKQDRKFQGIINRVQKRTQVLVEFDASFYAQHNSSSRYDISFSFNRVCLKRAHQALDAALHPSFENFLFPYYSYRSNYSPKSPSSRSFNILDLDQQAAMRHILGLKGSPPYLVEGPSIQFSKLSRTGVLVREVVSEIYRMVKDCRILISAPKNRTCDVLMSSLKKNIPESEMFRANAAFRDKDEVPEDIFSSCQYENNCFTCPPLQILKKFKLVFSTFVSGFRLHHGGIEAGHFSHIFLVDASFTIEPDVMITLANLANDDTSVIVTGSPSSNSRWVRSDIAWRHGLGKSFFQRLRENGLYETLDPAFITKLQDPGNIDTKNLRNLPLY